MILAEILHELEYALLEGNEKKVSSLLDAFGQESTQSDLVKEVCAVIGHLCRGEYIEVFRQQTAVALLGTNDNGDIPEIDVYISQRISPLLKTAENNEHSLMQRYLVLLVGVTSLQLFIQQNWTGPQLQCEAEGPHNFLPVLFRTESQKEKLREYSLSKLGKDGESIYRLARVPTYLLLARLILVDNQHQLHLCKSSAVWAIRCLAVQQQLLGEHSNNMKNSLFGFMDAVTENTDILTFEKHKSLACQVHLEFGYQSLDYYENVKAKEHFSAVLNGLELKLELMGFLGKRTKFQEKDTSQLRLVVSKVQRGDGEEMGERQNQEGLPKDVAMNDDTLLEKVTYKDSNSVPTLPSLSNLEQAGILAQCLLRQKSQAVERIAVEELVAYAECVLSQPSAWSVHALALLIRSRLEKGLPRKLERSMMQLQALLDAIEKESPKVSHRQLLFHCLPLPPRWTLQKEMAGLLQSIGSVKSAMEVYQQLEMWEQVIACYQVLGMHEKAENLIKEQLKIRETVTLWCLLGDTTKDASHYEKAWELSGHRSSRAQRSLGLLHLRAKRFAECIPCFQKSLELNSIQDGMWFSLGCAAMTTGDLDLAGNAFQRCVSLDSENTEAWNNLSHVHIRRGNKDRAHRTLKEALKSSYDKWQVWENFLVVSTDIGAFSDVINAFNRLMDLRDKYTDVEVLNCLVKAVNGGLLDTQGQSASVLRPKVLQLMGRMTSQVTSNYEVWRLYADLYLNEESMADKEKGLHFLVKAHRVRTQSSNWESDLTSFKEVLDMTSALANVYIQVAQSKQAKGEAVQLLSSGKLSIKQLLAKSKKHHTDSLTGQVRPELSEPVTELENSLQQIVELISALKS